MFMFIIGLGIGVVVAALYVYWMMWRMEGEE
jgi:hypothetical protein